MGNLLEAKPRDNTTEAQKNPTLAKAKAPTNIVENPIYPAINSQHPRSKWCVGALLDIWSKCEERWFTGRIKQINNKDEQFIVKFGGNKIKAVSFMSQQIKLPPSLLAKRKREADECDPNETDDPPAKCQKFANDVGALPGAPAQAEPATPGPPGPRLKRTDSDTILISDGTHC